MNALPNSKTYVTDKILYDNKVLGNKEPHVCSCHSFLNGAEKTATQ